MTNLIWKDKIVEWGGKVTLIVCIDEKNGMLFNNRRQSRDKKLIAHILKLVGDKKLWINNFSKELFEIEEKDNVIVDDDFINKIGDEDFCFVENVAPSILEERMNKIILYNWQRVYPADKYFDIDLSKWEIESEEELSGLSHERIVQKIYTRRD